MLLMINTLSSAPTYMGVSQIYRQHYMFLFNYLTEIKIPGRR
jgi:hypothetical protein